MLSFGRVLFWKKGFLPNRALYVMICFSRNFTSGRLKYQQYQTIAEIKMELEKGFKANVAEAMKNKSLKAHLSMIKPQKELKPKKMKDSFATAIIPLSTNSQLRDKYMSSIGYLRIGRLMEDVDIFAVWCCVKHITSNTTPEEPVSPFIVVTIRVDHIQVLNAMRQSATDVRLSGHVCWVGQSSLEVVVWLDQEVDGKWEGIMKALLLMASRNANNTGPALVNPIEPETDKEKELFAGGEKRKLDRLQTLKKSLLKELPTEAEFHMIHDLFKQTIDPSDFLLGKRILPPKSKWMQDATLNTLLFCHPEFRNLFNKIFGGFLIRQAVELSWMVAYTYGMRRPRLTHISDIIFHSPVDVGSLLKLYSCVNYTEKNYIQVYVNAEVFSDEAVAGKSTTSYNFTYDLGTECDKLYPLTYLEAMKYIDGRRHFKNLETF